MAPKSLCLINHTGHTQNIRTHTQPKNRNGFMIITGAILKYLSVNCTESSALSKVIPDIWDHSIAFTGSWVIPVRPLQPKANGIHSLMTPQTDLEPNGRWMSNMFQQPVIPALCLKSSTNIPSLMKPPENVLYTLIWNKAVTQR